MDFISLSSKDKTSGNINNYTLKLINPIEHIRSIKSVAVSIRKTWYTIMDSINTKIYIDVAATLYTATLTQGNYTPEELRVHMQTQINAAYTPDNLFTVTLSTLTSKYTITHASATFTMVFGTNTTASSASTIGFNAVDQTVAATSQEGDNIYNLSYDDTIYIRSFALSSGKSYIGNQKTAIILPVSVTGNFGDTIFFQASGDTWQINYSDKFGRDLQTIDLALYFEDKTTLVPLNGSDWRVTFTFVEARVKG